MRCACCCRFFAREIAAYDIQTKRCDLYGQDENHSERVMLIYDGLHYDALAVAGRSHLSQITEVTFAEEIVGSICCYQIKLSLLDAVGTSAVSLALGFPLICGKHTYTSSASNTSFWSVKLKFCKCARAAFDTAPEEVDITVFASVGPEADTITRAAAELVSKVCHLPCRRLLLSKL